MQGNPFKSSALAALPVLAFVVLICAACGGGGDTSATPLTKAQFLKQGDAICQKDYEERTAGLLRYSKRAQSMSKAEKEEVVLTVIVPSYKRDIERLSALAAPEREAREVEKILDEFTATVSRVQQRPSSIFAGASRQFGGLEKLTHAYGFKICGRS